MATDTEHDVDSDLVDWETLDPAQLLALRLLLDEKAAGVDINQDIEDLTHYPDRLLTSYRDEWVVYCKARLTSSRLEKILSNVKNVKDAYLQIKGCIADPEKQDERLVKRVREIERLLSADNVAVIESGPARKIRKLIGSNDPRR